MAVDVEEFTRLGLVSLDNARQLFVATMERGKANPDTVGDLDNKTQIAMISAAFGNVCNAYLNFDYRAALNDCETLITATAALAAGINLEGKPHV